MPADPRLAAFAEHTEATPADLTRIRAKLRARQAPRRSGWVVAAPMGALAMAGLLMVAVLQPSSPTPTEPSPASAASLAVVTVPAQPEPSAPELAASFQNPAAGVPAQPVEVAPGVTLTASGTGTLSGTATAPRLAWSAGTVDVEVQPGAGLDVQVQTGEALVQVVGTVFQVERGPLGTRVGVSRGEVAVACADGSNHALTAGITTTCLPTSAAGLLGRAQALRSQNAANETILATVHLGLDTSPSDTIHTELSALRVELLAQDGQASAALEAARSHLARATAGRRDEVARVGAALGFAEAGCEGAAPFLGDLPSKELAASALAKCQTGGGGEDPR